MDVTLEKTGELEGRLIVKIEKADYADRVKKELKEIGNTRQIPGFRKGHVDMAQLQKRFGKQVKASVLNDIASDAALKYIDDNKLDILGQPIPADSNEMDLDKEEYEFTYELGFAPELNMVFDQTVTLPFYNIEVTEQMIDDQDKDLRNRAGEQVPAQEYAERALVKGSIMQLDENGNVKENGIQVNDGILAPFLFKSKEEAAKFEGTKVGDKVVFDAFATCDGNEAEIASMLHIDRDKIEEARGNFEINIAEFVVHTPAELGQEFYDKVFGADTIHNEEEYRKRLSEIIAQGLQPNSRQLFTRNAEDYLMETYGAPMQLPMAFLRKFMLRTNTELKEDAVDEALNQSVPGIKWEIIENKAAELLNVKVTEDDVKAFARMVAIDQLNQYGMGHMADQMADYFAENLLKDKEQHRRIVRQTFNGNLMSAIHNAVKLDEKTVSLDEFRTIVAALNNASGAEVAAEEAPEA
ncbi:MAG: trigger factor family protein [Muribaculaceae bacterium]|nr:trigger factor family protein [Muribaculaceae bacterium]